MAPTGNIRDFLTFTGIFLAVYLSSYLLNLTVLLSTLGAALITTPIALLVKLTTSRTRNLPRNANQFSTHLASDLQKAVFITGCDSGFGNMLAERLSKKGYYVFAGCLNIRSPGALQLAGSSSSLQLLQCDVTKDDEVDECVRTVAQSLQDKKLSLWALVNNAGICTVSEFEWIPIKTYERIMATNALGSVRVIKAFLPMLRRHQGRVVIVASLAGRYAVPYFTGYSMSKHAQVALADGLRREMDKFGVKVSLIEPGSYRTNMAEVGAGLQEVNRQWNELDGEVQFDYGDQYYENLREQIKVLAEKCNPNVEEVVDVMEDAVTSPTPKKRYVPGTDGSFIRGHLLPLLPYWVQDKLLGKLIVSRSAPHVSRSQ